MRIHDYNSDPGVLHHHIFYKPTTINDGDYFIHNGNLYLCRTIIDNNQHIVVEFVKLIPDDRRQRTIVPEPNFVSGSGTARYRVDNDGRPTLVGVDPGPGSIVVPTAGTSPSAGE